MLLRKRSVKNLSKEITNVVNKPLTIGLREAAEMTGLSHWTLRKYIRKRRLQPIRIGRRVLLEPAELERLIAQGRTENKQ